VGYDVNVDVLKGDGRWKSAKWGDEDEDYELREKIRSTENTKRRKQEKNFKEGAETRRSFLMV
jgi:hypothetical protein